MSSLAPLNLAILLPQQPTKLFVEVRFHFKKYFQIFEYFCFLKKFLARSGMIFYRVGSYETPNGPMKYNLEVPIKEALFPGLQGGPHNNAIGGVCVALGQALKPEFRDYQIQACDIFFQGFQNVKFLYSGSEKRAETRKSSSRSRLRSCNWRNRQSPHSRQFEKSRA